MISTKSVQILALAAAAVLAGMAPASAGQSPKAPVAKTAADVTPEAFGVFSLTMDSAREAALRAQPDAYAMMSPADRAATAPRYADLAGPSLLAQSASGAGVEAAFTTASLESADPIADLTARQRLTDAGIANERVARESKDQAKYREPPRVDEKGYYFSYAQTRRYYSNRYTDRIGLYSSAYYETLRCRSAAPVGLLGENPEWRRTWSWRVCPDTQGRYRPTL